jgi:hypothetical protein
LFIKLSLVVFYLEISMLFLYQTHKLTVTVERIHSKHTRELEGFSPEKQRQIDHPNLEHLAHHPEKKEDE